MASKNQARRSKITCFTLQAKEFAQLRELREDSGEGNSSAVIRRLIREEYRRFKERQAYREAAEAAAEVPTDRCPECGEEFGHLNFCSLRAQVQTGKIG